MTEQEKREAIRQFINKWNGRGKEDEDDRSFWIDFLQALGVEHVTDRINFQKKVTVSDGHTKRIDAYIPETNVLIEQKSLDINLAKPQAGHDGKTPFEQAKEYDNGLGHSEKARWIVLSNFAEFWIYDMEQQNPQPLKLTLKDLQSKYSMFEFLIRKETKKINEEMELSLKAGEIVGVLYEELLKQYANPESEETLKSLNKLCVRIVFCLYAEDAGIFGKKNLFHDYMEQWSAKDSRRALVELFKVLNQKPEERDKYLAQDRPILAQFPYVNGGLFADEDIEIPPFTDNLLDLLLNKSSENFDWSGISPTIFGAVFESTLNPETRRSGGMHYTSIENIHKVIDPLFLDDIKNEFEEIKAIDIVKTRNQKLQAFQEKLASLKFMDPACGSGNFLTETYISIRRIENDVINLLTGGQMTFGNYANPIKVSISQFYGIEINDFAVTVAKTALWIAESQMMKETEDIVHFTLDFLPLKTNANIVEANALRIDWNTVCPASQLNYIMGNPPFVGYKFQTIKQKEDIKLIAGDFDNYGTLDYVSGWYVKTSKYILGTVIKAAFVSTNSVVQGEHVNTLWKPLLINGVNIFFARRTFRWDSEANIKAHVHCVIIGFSYNKSSNYTLWTESGEKKKVSQINGYLLDAPNVFIAKRSIPWNDDTPRATKGNAAMDDGNLIISSEQKDEILSKEPELQSIIKRHMSADDFLNGKENYCIWLHNVSPKLYANSKEINTRLTAVREYRNNSNRIATKKMADFPYLFAEIRQPTTNYIMLPVVSSERRRYVPIAFLTPDIINSYASISIPNANLYHFGILCSNVHNSWTRAVCGRLEMRYRYATSLVYNTFPWPKPTEEQKKLIEKTAQEILDARSLYPDCNLSELYDPLLMPAELRKAHTENDKAVMKAYGFDIKMSEAECVAELMKMYQRLVEQK